MQRLIDCEMNICWLAVAMWAFLHTFDSWHYVQKIWNLISYFVSTLRVLVRLCFVIQVSAFIFSFALFFFFLRGSRTFSPLLLLFYFFYFFSKTLWVLLFAMFRCCGWTFLWKLVLKLMLLWMWCRVQCSHKTFVIIWTKEWVNERTNVHKFSVCENALECSDCADRICWVLHVYVYKFLQFAYFADGNE